MNGIKRIFMGLVMASGVILTQPVMATGPAPVDLGSAVHFAVLAGSGITVAAPVNSTTITGDIGTFPTPSITGLGNVVLNGANHADDAVTQNAKNNLVTAYTNAAGRTYDATYAGGFDLVGLTLTSGVYNGGSSLALSGTLTLDAQGNPDAAWIFQAGSTLITASSSKVALTNGAQARNVFWQVGSSATLGTDSHFAGNILALESITLTTGATVDGRVLARNGAVTFDNNSASLPSSSQVITNFIPTNGSAFAVTNVVRLSAQASSGLLVSFAVTNGSGVITDGTNLAFANTGLVSIVASQAGDSNWNAAPTVTNTFNVTKAAATVTLNNQDHNYSGAARSVTATTVPADLSVTITYDGHSWAPTNVGSYAVVATITDANYSGNTNGPLVVSPLAVVLNGTRAYDGTATAAFGILAVTNKVGSDVVTVDSGSTTLASANVGTQNITVFTGLTLGGAASANYTLTGASGSLTVGTVVLTITGPTLSRAYGVANPNLAGIYSGEQNGETFTVTGGTTATTNSAVADYNIVPDVTGATLANYTVNKVNGQLTVGTVALTITASADSKIYGGTKTYGAGQTAFTSTELLNGETIGTVTITASGGITSNAPVGTYDLTPSLAAGGTLNPDNYAIVYSNGTLTVNKADQAITNFTPTNGFVFAVTNTTVLNATGGGSTNLVIFTVISGPGMISGRTNLTFTNAGTVNMTASQSGDTNWNAAPDVTNTFTVVFPSPSPDPHTGTADITASNMVYLPVNVTNLTTAGTVSFWLKNLGPDTLNSNEVAFDFRIGINDMAMVLLGSDQRAFNLAAGQEQLVILTAQAKRGLVVPATLSGIKQVQVTVRHASSLYDPNLANNKTTAAGTVRVRAAGVNSPGRSVNDYDGDGKSDCALWHAGSNLWALCLSGQRDRSISELYTDAGDWPVPGDYDGDGVTDMAIWCRLNSWWNVRLSSTEQTQSVPFFGGPDFTAVQGDFDGDSMTDPAVYRADGTWYGTASSEGYAPKEGFLGGIGYQPVVGDYDGDGLADLAVYNRTTGLWAISLSGRDCQIVTGTFGGIGYLPASADYDGDGLVDPAVYEAASGKWQVLMSGSEYALAQFFLQPSAFSLQPVPADYDGDGLADPAIYHQDTGLWELFPSSQGYELAWGLFGGPEFAPVME